MATLVLSTVGSALGGPVGGAIGALIGQSFDQQLLSPARRGPRLGDLGVQSSTYGTQIPRIYGSMRVAGSVVWATDLVESDDTSGAKGQPDVTYSYSVSLAVAISSRPVAAIGRIWADGKLLRGADGDFKVPVTSRFYDGNESQAIDPLIGSVEGIANTPAYRGMALAVFEKLELAAFGNRIPSMTFEVVADATAPTVSSILADASAGAIACDATQSLVGYAAYGSSIAAAVQPLVDSFAVPLFDDGTSLHSPADPSVAVINADELGSGADGEKTPKLQREQLAASAVPSTLRLTYYDPDRDYQTGEARAVAGEQRTSESQQDLPAALGASDAKSLAQQMLARQWAARDRLTLRLPPARTGLEPGSVVEPGVAPGAWLVDKCTIDGFVTIAELRPAWQPSTSVAADAGRIVANPDVVRAPTALALIDAPDLSGTLASAPVIMIAGSCSTAGWSSRGVTVTGSGQTFATETAARKAVLGHASTVLADADPYLIDMASSVDIELVDPEQWITSCDDDALGRGTNLAVLGSELIQFGQVSALGEGRFRIARLLRGRGGTEWATGSHSAGETFCLLDASALRPVALPISMRGTMVTVEDRDASTASLIFEALSVRPLAPVDASAGLDGSGDLSLRWTRRSRSGFAWVDEVDAPIAESREEYRVTISTSLATLELTATEPSLVVGASDLAPLGAGAATIEVRQIGDWSASLPAQLTIEFS
jgi:hypothetical protein